VHSQEWPCVHDGRWTSHHGKHDGQVQCQKDSSNAANNGEGSETIVGFAGSTADAFTLLERLEGKLDEHPGQLARSCVKLAKGWRKDKYLQRLEALLLVADETVSLELTGNCDVLESNDGVLGVGSGSPYSLAAARALMDLLDLTAEQGAEKAMNIASDMCVYMNKEFMVEAMDTKEQDEEEK
jgi:ATP-dependent HslUV protease, peptidase subunit HslV